MQDIIIGNRYRNLLGIPMIPVPVTPVTQEDDNVSDLGLDDICDHVEMANDTDPFTSKAFTDAFNTPVVEEKSVEKKKSLKKPGLSKVSRGTLGRKVTGNGICSKTKLSIRRRNIADVINYTPSNKRKRMVNAFTLGSYPSDMVPSSEGRRLLQVIHCISRDGGSVYNFFDTIPEKVQSLREVALKDVVENDVNVLTSPISTCTYDTFLRATFKNALCTVGKSEDYEFLPFVKYILQEKYESTGTMTATRLQALLGQICKENNTITREFPRFSFRKLGASKVSNVAFDILIL